MKKKPPRVRTKRKTKTENSSGPSYKILIIDDEEAIQESLKEILSRRGNSVDVVGTGMDALRMLNGSIYDIIICDMKLPDLNTVDLYRQLDDREKTLRKTIFISGDTSSERIHNFFSTTGAHYLTKPFRPSDLYQKIDEICGTNPYSSSSIAS